MIKTRNIIYLMLMLFCWEASSSQVFNIMSMHKSNYNAEVIGTDYRMKGVPLFLSHFSKLDETHENMTEIYKKMDSFMLFQKIAWELSPGELLFLLDNNRKDEINMEELDEVYDGHEEQKGNVKSFRINKSNVLNFINKYKLSPQEKVLFLLPIIREGFLDEENLFSVIREIKLSPNTKILWKDLLPLFQMVYENDIHTKNLASNPEVDYKLARLDRIFNAMLAIDFDIDSSTVISSLAHMITKTRDPALIKKLYAMKSFNPNATDILNQTPLHTLFFLIRDDLKVNNEDALKTRNRITLSYQNQSERSIMRRDLYPEFFYERSKEDWVEIFSYIQKNSKTDFNPKDISGMTPVALAVRWDINALKVLLDMKPVDLSVRDNYGRALAIISSHEGFIDEIKKSQLDEAEVDEPKIIKKIQERKEITRLILEKGGKITPSFLNEYLDTDLDFVHLQPLHPLLTIIAIAKFFNKDDSYQIGKYSSIFEKLLEERYTKIKQFRRTSAFADQFIKAIEEDNVDFFVNNYDKDENLRELLVKPFIQLIQNNKIVKDHNFLVHAISSNSPKVVRFMFDNVENDNWFSPQENILDPLDYTNSITYMDPLSEALFTTLRINLEAWDEDRELAMKKNQKMIRFIASHPKTNLEYINVIDLSPMEVAVLTGNLSTVKYLHEKKKIPLPGLEDTLWDTTASFQKIIQGMEFYNVEKYIMENTTGKKCEFAFLIN